MAHKYYAYLYLWYFLFIRSFLELPNIFEWFGKFLSLKINWKICLVNSWASKYTLLAHLDILWPILSVLICFSEKTYILVHKKLPTYTICIHICGFSSAQIYSDIHSIISWPSQLVLDIRSVNSWASKYIRILVRSDFMIFAHRGTRVLDTRKLL